MKATKISHTVLFEKPDNPHIRTLSEVTGAAGVTGGPIFIIQATTTPSRPIKADGNGSIINPMITLRKREKNNHPSRLRPSGTGNKLIINPMAMITASFVKFFIMIFKEINIILINEENNTAAKATVNFRPQIKKPEDPV
jgi:hypothetical protein